MLTVIVGVGAAHRGHTVLVRFDPGDCHFVFTDADKPDVEICRRPAKRLSVADITGITDHSAHSVPQQLPLPFPEGVG